MTRTALQRCDGRLFSVLQALFARMRGGTRHLRPRQDYLSQVELKVIGTASLMDIPNNEGRSILNAER